MVICVFALDRIQRLSEVQNTLVEEIQKMEQDVNLLKNMEKDLAVGPLFFIFIPWFEKL